MSRWRLALVASLVALLAHAVAPRAQSPVQSCDTTPKPSWCNAVPGDRAEGWLSQRRSEVMARNGMVASSQPLAVQAGVDVLRRGGNAIDAAVATAAVLSVVEPMNVGPAGDLFAIVYIAAEKKLYALDASGKAPSGQTLARMNVAGYRRNPANWGPGSGMPPGGILTVTVPGQAQDELRSRPLRSQNASHPTGVSRVDCRRHRVIHVRVARRSIPIRSPPGTSMANRRRRDRSIAIPGSRSCFASFSREAVRASMRATSHPQSSRSPSHSAGR